MPSPPTDGATPPPSAEGIADAVRAIAGRDAANGTGRKTPPVDDWNPPFCGDIDMRIARDGTWFYEGTPIGRPGLVGLFASILKREGDAYFLVTPVEKVGITVEDAPFVAVDFDAVSEGLQFRTNTGDTVIAGPEHPIRVERDATTDEPSPYILIRRNLEALIDRKSFYRLVDLAVHADIDGTRWFGIASGGTFFGIIPSDQLDR